MARLRFPSTSISEPNITTISCEFGRLRRAAGRVAVNGFEFSCPNTGGHIDPRIDGAEAARCGLERARFAALYVRCPHCGEHHEIKIDDDALTEAA
jgi:phage terminase large subunit GpA-like protein